MAVTQRGTDSHDVRARLADATFRPVWAVLGVVAMVHLLGFRLPTTTQYALLLATVPLLGLPHGALDHLTLPRARGRPLTLRGLVVFGAAYLVAAAAYGVAWLVAPSASFVGFILLTWFHWGQGDRAHLALTTDAGHMQDPWVNRLTVFVRGGLPMIVPLIAFPEQYRTVTTTVVGLFDPAGGEWLAVVFEPSVRLAVGVCFALVTIGTLLAGYRAGGRDWGLDAAETGLLGLFFATVPPVLAIGIYFAVWHSLRHLARLVAIDETASKALVRGDTGRLFARVATDALPATVGALTLFGGLAVVVPNEPGSLAGVSGVYLVLLAVLTLPHAGIVTLFDRVQGVVRPAVNA